MLVQGERVFSLDLETSEPAPRKPNEFHLLFGSSRDFEFLEDKPVDRVATRLDLANRREQAIDLTLMLLEGAYPDDLMAEVATDLSGLLADPDVVEQVESVLFSTLLPASADVNRTLQGLPDIPGLVRDWLARLDRLQLAIGIVHRAWLGAESSLGSNDPPRDEVDAACVRAGVFRRLVDATASGADLNSLQLELLQDEDLKQLLPYSTIRNLLSAWKSQLADHGSASDAVEEPQIQSEEWETAEGSEPETTTERIDKYDRHEVIARVSTWVDEIAESLKSGKEHRARREATKLTTWQMQYADGEEFACKSLCNIASTAASVGHYQLQLDLTRQAVELNGDNDPQAGNQLAEAWKNLGELEEALAAYDAVIELHPGDAVAQNGRAEVLKALNRLDEALAAYDAVILQHPGNAVAQTGRAEVLKALNRLDEALDAYDAVILQHPGDVFAQTGRAEVLKALGDLEGSRHAYEQARKDHPEDQVIPNGLAGVLVELEEWDEALRLVSDGPRQTRSDWVREHIHGMILLRRKQFDRAVEIFQRGVAECPVRDCRPYFLGALATTQLHQKKYREVQELIDEIDAAALQEPVRSLQVQLAGMQEDFPGAAKHWQALKAPRTRTRSICRPEGPLRRSPAM
jgi:tetratricopeptide (TPR) repeat protein